jgi:hypothetical protein
MCKSGAICKSGRACERLFQGYAVHEAESLDACSQLKKNAGRLKY